MKKIVIFSASILTGLFSLSFGQVNTSDLNSYVTQNYFGALAMDKLKDGFYQDLSLGQGVHLSYIYGEIETDEVAGRRFDSEQTQDSGSISYLGLVENFSFGLSVAYLSAETEAIGTDTNPNVALETDGDGWNVGAGIAFALEQITLSVHATIGELEFDSIRQNGQFTAKLASFDLDFFSFSTRLDYTIIDSESFNMSLYGELGYQSIENNGFTESNSPDLVRINSFDEDGTYGELGLTFVYKASETFVPFFNLVLTQDFGDDGISYTGTDSINANFASTVPDPAETLFSVDAGVRISFSEQFGSIVSFGYVSGDDREDVSASIGFAYLF